VEKVNQAALFFFFFFPFTLSPVGMDSVGGDDDGVLPAEGAERAFQGFQEEGQLPEDKLALIAFQAS